MYQLIYTSAAASHSPAKLSRILTRSRENNRARGVTGMLFSYRDSFLQVLEGGEVEVLSLASTIAGDGRHQQFTILSSGPVSEKLFGRWAMGYVDADLAAHLVDTYVPQGTPNALLALRKADALDMLGFFKQVVSDDLPKG